jgi:uncharacterized membrane protein YidH (DUF202 family)
MIRGYSDHAANERTWRARARPMRESDCLKDWQGPYDGLTLVLVGLALVVVAAVRFVRTG